MQAFVGKLIGDMGAAFTAPLIVVGDRLGLYKALAEIGPATAEAVAKHTGTFPRYVREWLAAQAAAGNVDHDPDENTFAMSPEQQAAFADDTSPLFMPGAYEVAASMFFDAERIAGAFRSGEGVGWASTTHACSAAPNASSGRATRPTLSSRGSQRSRASLRSWRPALPSLTSIGGYDHGTGSGPFTY